MQYLHRQWPFFFYFLLLGMVSNAGAQVGLSIERMGDLTVTLVYPTEQIAKLEKFGAFELQVATHAAPSQKLSNGRLIVMSHGTAGSGTSDYEMAATFARAGFVVAQPLHEGDNYLNSKDAGPVSFARRPLEVSAVIDAMAKEARFAPWLKTDKVGVHGKSAGGHTAISLAGGQWRMLDLVRHCAVHLQEDEGFCFNGIPAGAAGETTRARRVAQFKTGAHAPEMFLPKTLTQVHPKESLKLGELLDARVAVVTAAVPVAAIFSTESLKAIRIPVGLLTAGKDEWLLPKFHSGKLQATIPSVRTLIYLPQASHMDLSAPWPAEVAQAVAAQTARGGEVNPAFDAKDRVTAFERTAAFMRTHLLAQ